MARPMTTTRGGREQQSSARAESNYFAQRLRHEMSAHTLRSHVDRADADFLLVDVRDPAMYREGHIVGAVNLQPDEIVEAMEAEFPGERNVVVYSYDLGCLLSTHCADLLTRAGFTVRQLIGGFEYWKEHGHPVETGDPYQVDY